MFAFCSTLFQILADRGFTLKDDFALIGATLLTPAFTRGRKQLPGRDVEESRVKSNVRIHIGKYNPKVIKNNKSKPKAVVKKLTFDQ